MITKAKNELRQHIKNLISLMTSEEKSRQSTIIYEKLLRNEKFVNGKRIAIYLSLDREVNTKQVLNYCFQNEKQLYIPRYDQDSRHMDCVQLYSIDDYNSLPMTKWHIRQPSLDDNERPNAMTSGGLDVILVPGVAYTKSGLRLGNGKGYYDYYLNTFLSTDNKRPFLIGLAFNQQIVDEIPTDVHDVKLDLVLSPDESP